MLYRYIIAVSMLAVPASFLASNCFTWFDTILLGDLLLRGFKHNCTMANLSTKEAHDLARRTNSASITQLFEEKSLKAYHRFGYQVFPYLRLTSDKYAAATGTAPWLKRDVDVQVIQSISR
ncbi:unnamed protein product [Cylicocyclus nassatus]|uniref:Uncharacterized protein n=1 Tax=Cylicocyclus nassatus TaxID=53992 RepID=A0AA36DQU1_CYLNA|nr:unnamed protein product [Cylicocyclus nassatus]